MKVWQLSSDWKNYRPLNYVNASWEPSALVRSDEFDAEMVLGYFEPHAIEWFWESKPVQYWNHEPWSKLPIGDFSRLGGIVVVSERAKQVILDIASEFISLLPLDLEDKQVFLLQPTQFVDCLDQSSTIFKHVRHHRTKGPIKQIVTYAFQKDMIVDIPIFLLPETNKYPIYVTDTFKQAIESNNLTGLSFIDLAQPLNPDRHEVNLNL